MEYLRPGQLEQDQIRVGKSILMQLIVSGREDDSSDRINNSNQRICFNVNLFGSLEDRKENSLGFIVITLWDCDRDEHNT